MEEQNLPETAKEIEYVNAEREKELSGQFEDPSIDFLFAEA